MIPTSNRKEALKDAESYYHRSEEGHVYANVSHPGEEYGWGVV